MGLRILATSNSIMDLGLLRLQLGAVPCDYYCQQVISAASWTMPHRGYFCDNQHTCVSGISSSTFHIASCAASSVSGGSVGFVTSVYMTVLCTITTDGYRVSISTYSVLALMIQLLYQSSDIPPESSSSASIRATASIQALGLSTRAKAGVGVGLSLAVINAATIGVSLW